MKIARKPMAQLYLSEDETKMLDDLREKFSTDWEKTTHQDISRSEIVRRMIYRMHKQGPGQ